ncbi:hypothetical protein T4A_13343 [Trichinella pseudospiralis]|uniref:Uncharacterized protein n=1 Tax=Trichinella pseudospiralis TaxID=6337 RepID=A0A0V1DSY8_TRIPS|nr:hypothetical protein T4A_13343 [Trichinella pseudospiralis]
MSTFKCLFYVNNEPAKKQCFFIKIKRKKCSSV